MRLSRIAALLLFFLGFQSIRTYGQVVATWTDGSGNWSNAANWSSNPVVPNNGGGTTYSVTINTSNSVVSMDVPNATVNNLTIGALYPAGPNTLNINVGNSLSLVSGTSTNWGTLNSSGSLNISGTFNDFGNLNNLSGAVFSNTGSVDLNSDTYNYGLITNATGGNMSLHASWLYNYGTLSNSGQFTIDGTIGNYGTFANYGTVPISNGANVTLNYGTLTNYGTFNDSGGIVTYAGGTLTNYGVIVSQQSQIGGLDNSGTLSNVGTIANSGNNYVINEKNGTLFKTGTLNNTLSSSRTRIGPSPLPPW
jgi:hypothetical protein